MNEARISKRILIVDDDTENLQSLRRELEPWLTKEGVAIDLCESAEEALEIMGNSAYALLLTDNAMPGMSGTELVKETGKRYPTTVCMILIGDGEKYHIEGALSSGLFSFMAKPWEPEALRRQIEGALRVHSARVRHLDNHRRMSPELRLAIALQARLFSLKPPETEKGIVPSYVQLAAGALLGDYLDTIRLTDSSYLVLLGDISGHGVRTALVSAMLKTVFTPEYLAERGGENPSPAQLLSWLNSRITEFTQNIPDLFVAFSAFVVDNEDSVVTASSAGNPRPLFQRGNLIQPVEVYGVPLGVNSEAVYEETTVSMRSGDALFLFTDGIQLPRHGRSGADTDTLYQAILQSRHQEPVDRVVERLRTAAADQELGDDVTMVRLTAG
jgi:sigma-B regulation protein RsbU (phosphoserine phosphatase)